MPEVLPYTAYARVSGQLLLSVADTSLDPDKYPDGVIPTGKVTLAPSITGGFIRFAGSAQAVAPKPIVLTLNALGRPSLNGDTEVYIPPTNEGNPDGWTYTVSFQVKDPEGNDLPIPSYSIQAPKGETIDIFNLAPVASGGGTLTVQGPKASLADVQTLIDPSKSIERAFRRDPARFRVSADPATLVVNAAADASFNRSYVRGGAVYVPPPEWPIDNGKSLMFSNGGYEALLYPNAYGLHKSRFWMDGLSTAILWYTTAGTVSRFWVDGELADANQGLVVHTVSGATYTTVTFQTAKRRLIEVESAAMIASIYTKKPYKIWKPAPVQGPYVYVVGDSWTSPAIMGSSGAAALSPSQIFSGMWQDLYRNLDLDEIIVDGKGGTGYLKTASGFGNYENRVDEMNSGANFMIGQPDVMVFHGGGANERYGNSFSVEATIAQAIKVFTKARAKFPKTRLVFVEGFTPSAFPFRADYIAIRQGVQAGLAAAGIRNVYYIDTATTDPWVNGLGNVNAVNADGENNNIYMGGDAAHYTLAGAAYLRDRMAVPMRKILRDTGALDGTLV